MDPVDRIVHVLEEIKLRRGLSGEATEELKYISTLLEKIERNTTKMAEAKNRSYPLVFVAATIVFTLILWKVLHG